MWFLDGRLTLFFRGEIHLNPPSEFSFLYIPFTLTVPSGRLPALTADYGRGDTFLFVRTKQFTQYLHVQPDLAKLRSADLDAHGSRLHYPDQGLLSCTQRIYSSRRWVIWIPAGFHSGFACDMSTTTGSQCAGSSGEDRTHSLQIPDSCLQGVCRHG